MVGSSMRNNYDLIVVGGGITGSALLYAMAEYTNISSILLLEKYEDLALLNSSPSSNSQTLHFGDVETNYSLKKAKETRYEAEKVLRYCNMLGRRKRELTIRRCQKMVLGVGDDETDALEKTVDSGIGRLFPGLSEANWSRLSKIEPNLVRGRDKEESILALVSDVGYMVNFGELAHSFVGSALKNKNVHIDILFNTPVRSAVMRRGLYNVSTRKGAFTSRFIVFATGSHSLLFAKSLGCDENLSIIAVGGNYYVSKRMLNGKVYRVQKGGIPFAAVHADPDITNPRITRYGPTVTLPMGLETRRGTFIDYLRSFDYDIKTLDTLFDVLMNKDIRNILMTNGTYGLPLIGKRLFFENEVRKIIPSIRYSDLKFGTGMGGIRPQIVDENIRFFVLGASKAKGRNAIFNITPSPGASSALASGLEDMQFIARELDLKVDLGRCEAELGKLNGVR